MFKTAVVTFLEDPMAPKAPGYASVSYRIGSDAEFASSYYTVAERDEVLARLEKRLAANDYRLVHTSRTPCQGTVQQTRFYVEV